MRFYDYSRQGIGLNESFTYGSSLRALEHADQNNTKLIIGDLKFPRIFEPEHVKQAWGLIYSKLMLRGQIFGGDSVKNVRVSEDDITIVCRGNVVRKTEYDSLYVFGDKNISGLPAAIKLSNMYDVVDIMRPLSLVSEGSKVIETTDDFVSKLFIEKKYKTAPIKLYAVSTLNEERIYDFNYSDTMAKFKSEDLLNRNNFRGSHSGGKRIKISLEVLERRVDKKMDFYDDSERIKFIHGS